jgi:hypothetical protein
LRKSSQKPFFEKSAQKEKARKNHSLRKSLQNEKNVAKVRFL